jgi:hypothetical protein
LSRGRACSSRRAISRTGLTGRLVQIQMSCPQQASKPRQIYRTHVLYTGGGHAVQSLATAGESTDGLAAIRHKLTNVVQCSRRLFNVCLSRATTTARRPAGRPRHFRSLADQTARELRDLLYISRLRGPHRQYTDSPTFEIKRQLRQLGEVTDGRMVVSQDCIVKMTPYSTL